MFKLRDYLSSGLQQSQYPQIVLKRGWWITWTRTFTRHIAKNRTTITHQSVGSCYSNTFFHSCRTRIHCLMWQYQSSVTCEQTRGPCGDQTQHSTESGSYSRTKWFYGRWFVLQHNLSLGVNIERLNSSHSVCNVERTNDWSICNRRQSQNCLYFAIG
jgi:hypothetical protein